jgi:peptidyl-prolyl cis-trans isomerase A (cyclophilin A)
MCQCQPVRFLLLRRSHRPGWRDGDQHHGGVDGRAGNVGADYFLRLPRRQPSNVVVQLFDHEKPATVANFLHYITPAVAPGIATNVAFSNMIWDRCIPGFVLQGGDYDAVDRTNTTWPPNLESIYSDFTQGLDYAPPFPLNIDNEFGVGPLIHNTFGTMAMAKSSGNPDSAANAFFFNLADNSSNLDNQNGGFTVFGQILSGMSCNTAISCNPAMSCNTSTR